MMTTTKPVNPRLQPGGDLYIRPLTREEMLAPLKWHEKQMAVCRRYGERADGTIGSEIVARAGVLVSSSPRTLDLGNNETKSSGVFPQPDGTFLALTFSASKSFKTRAGAERWHARMSGGAK